MKKWVGYLGYLGCLREINEEMVAISGISERKDWAAGCLWIIHESKRRPVFSSIFPNTVSEAGAASYNNPRNSSQPKPRSSAESDCQTFADCSHSLRTGQEKTESASLRIPTRSFVSRISRRQPAAVLISPAEPSILTPQVQIPSEYPEFLSISTVFVSPTNAPLYH